MDIYIVVIEPPLLPQSIKPLPSLHQIRKHEAVGAVEVGSLHILRLQSLKLVFQPLHNFLLTNYSFGK